MFFSLSNYPLAQISIGRPSINPVAAPAHGNHLKLGPKQSQFVLISYKYLLNISYPSLPSLLP